MAKKYKKNNRRPPSTTCSRKKHIHVAAAGDATRLETPPLPQERPPKERKQGDPASVTVAEPLGANRD